MRQIHNALTGYIFNINHDSLSQKELDAHLDVSAQWGVVLFIDSVLDVWISKKWNYWSVESIIAIETISPKLTSLDGLVVVIDWALEWGENPRKKKIQE